jgi:hypothetical protein
MTAKASDEHAVPDWARRAFDIPGSLTLWAGDRSDEPARRRVANRPSLRITLNGAICQDCNNGFLSRLENLVSPLLTPMMLTAKSTKIDQQEQKDLATWAIKTSYLLEFAVRQHYPESRPHLGYPASEPELAWLWAKQTPPPRSLVWLGCWDCRRTTPVMYEPSSTQLPGQDGHMVTGHLTTLALGFVVFQVFTVNFVFADEHDTPSWNPEVPVFLQHMLRRIWPAPLSPIEWPQAAFASEDWNQLVTWGGALRPPQVPVGD